MIRIVVKKLEERDTRVIYLRGNHDDFLATFLPPDFKNLSVVEGHIHEGMHGRYLVLHGDIFATAPKKFRLPRPPRRRGYRTLLQLNRACNAWRARRGKEYWSLSKAIKARVKEVGSHISNFEEHISALARKRGCPGVMSVGGVAFFFVKNARSQLICDRDATLRKPARPAGLEGFARLAMGSEQRHATCPIFNSFCLTRTPRKPDALVWFVPRAAAQTHCCRPEKSLEYPDSREVPRTRNVKSHELRMLS